jgi:hypothetical protein
MGDFQPQYPFGSVTMDVDMPDVPTGTAGNPSATESIVNQQQQAQQEAGASSAAEDGSGAPQTVSAVGAGELADDLRLTIKC